MYYHKYLTHGYLRRHRSTLGGIIPDSLMILCDKYFYQPPFLCSCMNIFTSKKVMTAFYSFQLQQKITLRDVTNNNGMITQHNQRHVLDKVDYTQVFFMMAINIPRLPFGIAKKTD